MIEIDATMLERLNQGILEEHIEKIIFALYDMFDHFESIDEVRTFVKHSLTALQENSTLHFSQLPYWCLLAMAMDDPLFYQKEPIKQYLSCGKDVSLQILYEQTVLSLQNKAAEN
jgi:hypothetical protein